MSRIALLAIAFWLAATPAAADDRELCLGRADSQSRLAACTRVLDSGRPAGTELARLLVARAALLLRQRDADRALADLDAAIAADARHAAAYFWRGRAFAAKHDHARALADFNEAIRLEPHNPAPYNRRGLLRHELGDLDQAIADFGEALRIAPKNVMAYASRSRTFTRKRDFDRALADADAAIRIDPKYPYGYIQRGVALSEMQDFDGALAAYDKAAELDPKSADILAGRAHVLVERKQYDRAIAEFNDAIKLDARSGSAYRGRARAYLGKGDLEQALVDANSAIKISPNGALPYNTRGLVLHARRDYDEAIADFSEALRREPGRVAFLSNRGRSYNAKKEFDRAIRDLDEAIRMNPNAALAYWNRAISYENKKEFDKALADWRATLRLQPKNINATRAIRRLERVMSSQPQLSDRVALVIGNSNYVHGEKLPNPVNDASDFASLLRKLGFSVVEGHNLDKRRMEELIGEFGRKLETAGVAVFFYAGHGTQVDGENQLVPVDASLERSADLKRATVNVAQVLAKMEADQRVNLIFLDACRDNPFGGPKGRGQTRGLAPIQNAIGTLTAFATKPYHVAFDGSGRNSPFTAALLKHAATPGLEIGSVLKRVRAEVIQTTGGKQVPFDESSLITDVVLAN
jgi:tetratricopeptide (TPR) repeat protein